MTGPGGFSRGAVSRRAVLLAAAAAAAPPPVCAAGKEGRPLRQRAAAKGLLYGGAMASEGVADPQFAAAFARDCAVLTPEWEMKWGAVEKREAAPDYGAADRLLAFAARNAMAVRGHTLIWAQNIPKWLPEALAGSRARDVYGGWLRRTLRHFKGRLLHWDVVNEALEPRHGQPGGLRHSLFYEAFRPSYIDEAFHLAADIDPAARRYYNDYGFWAWTREMERRRKTLLEFLEGLRSRGVPVGGIGLQAHLYVNQDPFDQAVFRRFLADAAALDLEITITELDVNDRFLPAAVDIARRDRQVADLARAFLDAALDEPAVKGVVTWGLSDRYTFLNRFTPQNARWTRPDGGVNRALPLDAALARKPLWHAIAEAFDNAPAR